ncbi:TetR/AcrR family transcriptional regulator [Spirillospora sp. CA-255316]
MSPRPRLREEEKEEYARRLVEAAFRVIAATSDTEPAVRSILREAGLSQQAFYRCFSSKDDLLDAVLAEGRRLLVEHLTRRMSREPTPEGKIRAWVAGVMQQAEAKYAADRTRPFVTGMGRRAAANPAEAAKTERQLGGLLEEVIAVGNADGSWDSADPAGDALIIHDFVLASLRRHLIGGVPPSRSTSRDLADFALRALRVPADRPETPELPAHPH